MKQQIAEIELSYRNLVFPRKVITSCSDALKIIREHWNPNTLELQEEFKVLLLNRANEVLGIYEMSKGGITGTVADCRLIFSAALKANATGIILVHNHPSGNAEPSIQDKELTKRIVTSGKMLEISVLDHLIITTRGYSSLADMGIIE